MRERQLRDRIPIRETATARGPTIEREKWRRLRRQQRDVWVLNARRIRFAMRRASSTCIRFDQSTEPRQLRGSLPARGAVLLLACAMLSTAGACTPPRVPLPGASGCTGLFTDVELLPVSREERVALVQETAGITRKRLRARLRENYYRIAYEEGGGESHESLSAFLDRRLARERVPSAVLVTIDVDRLEFVTEPEPAKLQALREAVSQAQLPLARRLDRVTRSVAAAAPGREVTSHLDARLGLNAGAELGFTSRRVLIGPELVLLAGSADALAFVISHEVAHIVRDHTRITALQDMMIAILTLGYTFRSPNDTIAGILSHGTMPAFNRDKECEADYYALQYMRTASYDPAAAAPFLRLLGAVADEADETVVPVFSSYPSDAERIIRLEQWAGLPEAPDLPVLAWDRDKSTSQAVRTLETYRAEEAVRAFGIIMRSPVSVLE